MKILVSACLLGTPCRYDGKSKPCPAVLALSERHELIPVCPEVDGGLSTPRAPSELQPDRCVINALGEDVTSAYLRGAEIALQTATERSVSLAILKAKSPSCGCGKIYDGSFSRSLIPGDGVTAALLKKNGLRVLTEEELDTLQALQ